MEFCAQLENSRFQEEHLERLPEDKVMMIFHSTKSLTALQEDMIGPFKIWGKTIRCKRERNTLGSNRPTGLHAARTLIIV